MTFQETTTPLLRPAQAQEWKEQAASLRQMLSAPPHIANRIEDRGQMTKNLRALERDLKSQEPRPYEEKELDSAVSRSELLKGEILVGMPTGPEMRRNPAGSTDKHRRWEKRNKKKLSEWKNIQLRLHQTGDAELPDATDIANFERFRPTGGAQELNMHNEQIPGTQYHLPPPDAAPVTVLTDQDIETVARIDPDINLATLDNEQRAKVRQFIDSLQSVSYDPETTDAALHLNWPDDDVKDRPETAVVPKKVRKKRVWTQEQKDKQMAALKRGRETAARNRVTGKTED